jgi:hypothetical protein
MECPIVSPPIEIRQDNLDNRRPSAVFNTNHGEFLVAWDTAHDLFTTDVWAARVSLEGQVISTFNLATKAGEHRYDPDIAYDPERDKYLIAYSTGAPSSGINIYFVTTNWDGSSVQAERPVNKDTSEQLYPSVVFNPEGDDFLIVYENSPNINTDEIAAQRLRASDGKRKNWRVIASSPGESRYPTDAVHNPFLDAYLILYEFLRPGSVFDGMYAITSSDLSLVDADNRARPAVIDAGYGRIAAGIDEFLYVWSNRVNSGIRDIHGRFFDINGVPIGPDDGFVIASEGLPLFLESPQVAFAGDKGYLVGWTDEDNNAVGSVYGIYVSSGQQGAAGNPFPIFEGEADQRVKAIACTPRGACLVVIVQGLLTGSNTDEEIRGKLVRPCSKVSLPLVYR